VALRVGSKVGVPGENEVLAVRDPTESVTVLVIGMV
jgi:hypothetical protein